MPKFSIITPSFRNAQWLKLCIASVADQEGVEWEHILRRTPVRMMERRIGFPATRASAFLLKRTTACTTRSIAVTAAPVATFFPILNCDEQYLPGALRTVNDFFERHPQIEVMLGGTIIVNGEGNYICHRHSMTPRPLHIWFRFPILTSSIFIRRRVIHQRGIFFDTRWRDLGDFHWILALMKNAVPMAACDSFTSVFTDTGENMNLKPNAIREKKETAALTPPWIRWLKPVWVAHHRLRRLAAGHFSLKPTSYLIYTLQSPEERVRFDVSRPTAVWWNRL